MLILHRNNCLVFALWVNPEPRLRLAADTHNNLLTTVWFIKKEHDSFKGFNLNLSKVHAKIAKQLALAYRNSNPKQG
jgi:hypothetical protein